MVHELVVPPGTVGLLARLVDELVALHDEPDEQHPAWQRLYPATSTDDTLDADLRDLVHPDLVAGRREAFTTVQDLLATHDEDTERLAVDDEQAVALLGVVNDVRLAIAARIDLPGMLEGRSDGPVPDETTVAAVQVVDWLAMLQEQVLAGIAPESQSHFDDPVHDDD
ncbi:DUF2017 family protein [Salsipaludibacter albus]|uniref:DUF2017 family protein n=1 Tax=Salsipaludibacter albus TaxID=2849650 RepID=UPI001EE4C2A4|nr:DUF2017 family protein [Salsipaludibacter albus]MBY5161636.1 DUF2017 domain-containing protein [Salsipaludibacter albus]